MVGGLTLGEGFLVLRDLKTIITSSLHTDDEFARTALTESDGRQRCDQVIFVTDEKTVYIW